MKKRMTNEINKMMTKKSSLRCEVQNLDLKELKKAIVLNEVLGKPRAMRKLR